jgi:hypothetical protein
MPSSPYPDGDVVNRVADVVNFDVDVMVPRW